MQRAFLGALCLLIALPLMAQGGTHKMPLTSVRCLSLEHATGEWRMQINCREGAGTIALNDAPGPRQYRGSGVFEGWSQEEMDSLYRSLVPNDDAPYQLMQLG